MQTYPVEMVAQALHITPQALRKRIKEGKVRAIRIGKRWEVPEDEFNRLVSEARGVAFTKKEAEEEKAEKEGTVNLQPFLERLTESVVLSKEPGVDALKLRLYKSAVLQLFGDLTSMHRWGTGMVLTMSEDELRGWWVGRWVKAGLSRDVLEALYDTLKKRLSTYTSLRHRERLRFLRKRLIGVG